MFRIVKVSNEKVLLQDNRQDFQCFVRPGAASLECWLWMANLPLLGNSSDEQSRSLDQNVYALCCISRPDQESLETARKEGCLTNGCNSASQSRARSPATSDVPNREETCNSGDVSSSETEGCCRWTRVAYHTSLEVIHYPNWDASRPTMDEVCLSLEGCTLVVCERKTTVNGQYVFWKRTGYYRARDISIQGGTMQPQVETSALGTEIPIRILDVLKAAETTVRISLTASLDAGTCDDDRLDKGSVDSVLMAESGADDGPCSRTDSDDGRVRAQLECRRAALTLRGGADDSAGGSPNTRGLEEKSVLTELRFGVRYDTTFRLDRIDSHRHRTCGIYSLSGKCDRTIDTVLQCLLHADLGVLWKDVHQAPCLKETVTGRREFASENDTLWWYTADDMLRDRAVCERVRVWSTLVPYSIRAYVRRTC